MALSVLSAVLILNLKDLTASARPPLSSPTNDSTAPPLLGFTPRSSPGQLDAEAHALTVPTPENARKLLRTLTAEPHVAGTPADYKTAVFVRDKLREWGWKAELAEMEVLLNYPDQRSPALQITRPIRKICRSGRGARRDRQGLGQQRRLRGLPRLWRLGRRPRAGRLRELRPARRLRRPSRRWGSTSRTRSSWPATADSSAA